MKIYVIFEINLCLQCYFVRLALSQAEHSAHIYTHTHILCLGAHKLWKKNRHRHRRTQQHRTQYREREGKTLKEIFITNKRNERQTVSGNERSQRNGKINIKKRKTKKTMCRNSASCIFFPFLLLSPFSLCLSLFLLFFSASLPFAHPFSFILTSQMKWYYLFADHFPTLSICAFDRYCNTPSLMNVQQLFK